MQISLVSTRDKSECVITMNDTKPTAAERLAEIQAALKEGRRVQVSTYLKSTVYDERHIGMFRATEKSLYVQRGRAWDCIDYCSIRIERKVS